MVDAATFARICDLLDEYHVLGAAEADDRGTALFLSSDDAPTRYDGNHVRRIRMPQGAHLDAFLAEVDEAFALRPFRSVRIDPLTTPPALEARLLLDGWACHGLEIVMATPGPIRGRAADIEIRSLSDHDEAGWQDLAALVRADHADDGTLGEVMAMHRRRCPPFTWHLAYAGDQPIGYFSERVRDGLGYLEHLFVVPEHRLEGVATALVRQAAAAARSKGAGLVFLPCAADDTPKRMYAGMGFEPLFLFRNYLKRL